MPTRGQTKYTGALELFKRVPRVAIITNNNKSSIVDEASAAVIHEKCRNVAAAIQIVHNARCASRNCIIG